MMNLDAYLNITYLSHSYPDLYERSLCAGAAGENCTGVEDHYDYSYSDDILSHSVSERFAVVVVAFIGFVFLSGVIGNGVVVR